MPDLDPVSPSIAARPVISSSTVRPTTKTGRPPNILWMQIDDVGVENWNSYDDCNQWSSYDYPVTPRLDAIAASGMRFRRNYSLPSCSPTKACNLTGRMSTKTLVSRVINAGMDYRLPATEITAQDIATAKGSTHATLHVGKHHLALGMVEADLVAGQHGVDRYIGCPVNLYQEENSGYAGDAGATVYYEYDSDVGGEPQAQTDYATYRERTKILSWVAAQDQPWMVSWWMHAAHSPYHWPDSSYHTQGVDPILSAWRYWKTMIEATDTILGQVLDGMATEDRDNLLIVVTSDNGSPPEMVDASYVGHYADPPPDIYNTDHAKGTPYEGGTHTPLIVSGPGVQPGSVCDALTWACDIMPTLSEILAAGWRDEAASDMDGESLVPLFTNPLQEIHDMVYSATWTTSGLEITDAAATTIEIAAWEAATGYKLILTRATATATMVEELYNIGADPTSRTDPHEASPIAPGTTDADDAAFLRLATYIIQETGLSWTTAWSVDLPDPS